MQNKPVDAKPVPVQRGTPALGRLHAQPSEPMDPFRYSRLFPDLKAFQPGDARLVELGRVNCCIVSLLNCWAGAQLFSQQLSNAAI